MMKRKKRISRGVNDRSKTLVDIKVVPHTKIEKAQARCP
jgi:hypothetical protein